VAGGVIVLGVRGDRDRDARWYARSEACRGGDGAARHDSLTAFFIRSTTPSACRTAPGAQRHHGGLHAPVLGADLQLAVYIARILSLPVRAGYIVLIMPVVTLVELIPFSIAGLGTREATVIYFFSVVGAGAADAVGFSIVYVLIGTYLTALVGFFLWLKHPVRWRAMGV
jgi:hypothetical protein